MPGGIRASHPSPPSPLQDNSEADADCGGPCAPCQVGRRCASDADCDQAGSTVAGTAYAPGTTMVVCAASLGLCTDLRAGLQAYAAAGAAPAAVAFNVTVGGLPPALLSQAALAQARAAIAGVLRAQLYSLIAVGSGVEVARPVGGSGT